MEVENVDVPANPEVECLGSVSIIPRSRSGNEASSSGQVIPSEGVTLAVPPLKKSKRKQLTLGSSYLDVKSSWWKDRFFFAKGPIEFVSDDLTAPFISQSWGAPASTENAETLIGDIFSEKVRKVASLDPKFRSIKFLLSSEALIESSTWPRELKIPLVHPSTFPSSRGSPPLATHPPRVQTEWDEIPAFRIQKDVPFEESVENYFKSLLDAVRKPDDDFYISQGRDSILKDTAISGIKTALRCAHAMKFSPQTDKEKESLSKGYSCYKKNYEAAVTAKAAALTKVSALEVDNKLLKSKADGLESEKRGWDLTRSILESKKQALSDKVASLEASLFGMGLEMDTLSQECDTLLSDAEVAKDKLSSLNDKLSEAERAVEQAQKTLTQEKGSLTKEIKVLTSQVKKAFLSGSYQSAFKLYSEFREGKSATWDLDEFSRNMLSLKRMRILWSLPRIRMRPARMRMPTGPEELVLRGEYVMMRLHPAELHALRLRAERRRDYRRMQARNRWAWDADLERERLANERWMEECLREGVPFYPLNFLQAALGLGTYASSRVEPAPPLALCPFGIFPPVLAPIEEVKEGPEVSEGSSTHTTAAYYPELEANAQSENLEEVHVLTNDSPSVFCISTSSFPQESPRVVSEIIRPPSSSNGRGWIAMRRAFQQRESFSV
uniref:Uncharacterized protein n=1 Tax=Cannabis sativa TaxID=3483 RepID=A0A803PYR0_CANSA